VRILPQDTDYDITLFVDGGSRGNPGPAAIGAIIKKDGQEISRIARFIGEATNNIAEYTALVEGLRRAATFKPTSIHVKADSELMVKQVLGKFKVKNAALKPLHEEAIQILKKFENVGIERIPREKNGEADALVNEALDERAGKKKNLTKPNKHGLVGFLSDFGTDDAWAAVVKGVMKKTNASVEIIDISHEVPAYDIRKGAFVLETAVEHIPASVFLAVVDPEVGGERRCLIIGTTSGVFLVGPDNGLLMPATARLGGAVEAYAIMPTKDAGEKNAPSTFHARDIFGPAAAQLAGGTSPKELGAEIDRSELVKAPYGRADIAKGKISAEIIDVDRFGTLRLNIRRRDAETGGYKTGHSASVTFDDTRVKLKMVRTFSDVKPGEAMLVYDSSDYLCLSVNGAHAGLAFGLSAGDRLDLSLDN
jgi:S-adenosyl-L-methionine hydrolase (adenosine-forming)